jgi:hypothetical protein
MIDIPVDLAVIDIANLNVAVRPHLRNNPVASAEHDQLERTIISGTKRTLFRRTPVVMLKLIDCRN